MKWLIHADKVPTIGTLFLFTFGFAKDQTCLNKFKSKFLKANSFKKLFIWLH